MFVGYFNLRLPDYVSLEARFHRLDKLPGICKPHIEHGRDTSGTYTVLRYIQTGIMHFLTIFGDCSLYWIVRNYAMIVFILKHTSAKM